MRLDPRAHAAVQRWAEEDLRSLNGQIEYIPRQALAQRGVKRTDEDKPDGAVDADTQPPAELQSGTSHAGAGMSVTIAISENPPVTVPNRATASRASFRKWAGNNDLPEKAKLCYYQGEVFVEIGTEQLFSHAEVKSEIAAVLRTFAKHNELGYLWCDGVLLTHEAAGVSTNPDAVFISNDAIQSKRIKLVAGKASGYVELLGSADMVLEVVSDSSEKKDNQTLFEAYYDSGVSEYWLVDARGPEIEFYIDKRGAKKFTATKKQDGWLKSACFGKSFRLVRGTDGTGHPEFTLEVK